MGGRDLMANPVGCLQDKLEAGAVVVIDGGTATDIPIRGVPPSATNCYGSTNLSHPRCHPPDNRGLHAGLHEDLWAGNRRGAFAAGAG